MRLKVLLADDEPYIVEGLSKLIDWEAEGFEIVKKASNGLEAYEYLKNNKVDIIFADIQMPEITGLELLQRIKEEEISDAYFIIVSGFNDFKYAQTAIRYGSMDYVLKPLSKETLMEILAKASLMKDLELKELRDSAGMKRAYLIQNLMMLLRGKFEDRHLDYIRTNLRLSDKIRYIHVSFDSILALDEYDESELLSIKNRMFECCRGYLGINEDHCIKDIPGYEEEYEVGFIYCDYMAKEREITEKEFMEGLSRSFERESLGIPIVLLIGKSVDELSKISYSYSSASTLRSFKNFRERKPIYFYEEEMQVNEKKVALCKKELDSLIAAIEQNDKNGIDVYTDKLFDEMETASLVSETINMNTNYLLFRLIHLAVEQDESVNQEEVMLYISENVFDTGIARGSRLHTKNFSYEYADYLISLRKNVSRGILADIEKEINDNYSKNLTLRELSQKYYVNSSYLGQIFKKKYGMSFKDYLSNYRVQIAAGLLLKSDMKIAQIAEEVGYKDTDYFINRFIALKGCTPSKYRKNAGEDQARI